MMIFTGDLYVMVNVLKIDDKAVHYFMISTSFNGSIINKIDLMCQVFKNLL